MKIKVLDTFPVEGDPTAEEAALVGNVFETNGFLAGIETIFGPIFPEGTISIDGFTASHLLYAEEYEIVE